MLGAVNAPFEDLSLNVGSITYGLAHLAQENEVYREFLKQSQKFTILDNAADELGAGKTGQGLWDLVQEIKPDELILPDVLKKKDETVKASTDFYQEFVAGEGDQYYPKSLMAVAQGETWEEFLECYNEWHEVNWVDVIGIPYDIDFELPFFKTGQMDRTNCRAVRRIQLVRYLSMDSATNGKPLHLLGMNNLWELRQYELNSLSLVRSNDSTGPFAAAKNGMDWSQRNERFKKLWPALDFSAPWSREEKMMAFRNLVKYSGATGDSNLAFNAGVAFDTEEFANV